MTKEQRAKIVKYLEQTLRKMRGLFSNTYIQSIEEMRDAIEAGADFKWDDFKAQSQKIDKLIDSLLNKTGAMIFNGVTSTYQTAVNNSVKSIQDKYEALKKKYTRKKDIRETTAEATDVIRGGANSKVDSSVGERISSRVWNLKDDVKNTITIEIKNAIAQGLSVDQAKNWVKNYLNNPKLITMYVKDKDGNLVMSEEAKSLHPGRGVYRDPLKNAERLLRTEIMAAYRQAEIEQYQKTDLVIGYEIKLSGNHTTTDGKGGIKKLKDICDKLQGRYPKTFMWHGWHPNCRCVLLPIYVSDDMMDSYFEAKHNGTLDDWNKKNQISVLPKNLNEWVQDNSQRLNLAQNAKKTALPQWVEDNEEVKRLASNTNIERFNKIDTNSDNKTPYKESDISRQDKVRISIELNNRIMKQFSGIKKIVIEKYSIEEQNGMMSVNGNTLYINTLKIPYSKGEYCPAEVLKNALDRLKKGLPLETFEQEYSIESLYHEYLHNQSKINFAKIMPKSAEDILIEACTQAYAREKYQNFLALYGKYVKPMFQDQIRENGLGYSPECKLIREIFSDDNGVFIPSDIIGIVNGDIEDRIKYLYEACKKKGKDFKSVIKSLSKI